MTSSGLQSIIESEEYQLERQATAHKQAGDWAGAITCLMRAQAIRGPLHADTRLAKYLQQAGLFDEAMQEIQDLIDGGFAWAEGNFGHQPPSVRRRQQAGWLARLHQDAALICRREKQKDRQAHHEAEAERWRKTRDLIEPVAEQDKKRERQQWEEAKSKGAAAMTGFFEKREKGMS